MTNDQFCALAILIRLRAGPAQEGARLVLVNGHATTAAAAQVGTSVSSVSNTVQRCRRGIDLCKKALALHA